jgi:hypothetical protein
VILEQSYNGATSTYAIPQQLFKDKFLPAAIANGDLAADDKQGAQVNEFMWRWQLFTNTLTIQKPTSPDGKPITLNELVQYFPKTTVYRDIRAKVKGYSGFNNRDAFENTLVCAKGFELYGTIIDDRLFTDLDDYSKWVKNEADKTDSRYALWRCIAGVARSREQTCRGSGSENNPANTPWTVSIGYEKGAYPAHNATPMIQRPAQSSLVCERSDDPGRGRKRPTLRTPRNAVGRRSHGHINTSVVIARVPVFRF